MSNLLFNIRFGVRHFQISRDMTVSFKVNPSMVEWRDDPMQNWSWKWFSIYCIFGKHL